MNIILFLLKKTSILFFASVHKFIILIVNINKIHYLLSFFRIICCHCVNRQEDKELHSLHLKHWRADTATKHIPVSINYMQLDELLLILFILVLFLEFTNTTNYLVSSLLWVLFEIIYPYTFV